MARNFVKEPMGLFAFLAQVRGFATLRFDAPERTHDHGIPPSKRVKVFDISSFTHREATFSLCVGKVTFGPYQQVEWLGKVGYSVEDVLTAISPTILSGNNVLFEEDESVLTELLWRISSGVNVSSIRIEVNGHAFYSNGQADKWPVIGRVYDKKGYLEFESKFATAEIAAKTILSKYVKDSARTFKFIK